MNLALSLYFLSMFMIAFPLVLYPLSLKIISLFYPSVPVAETAWEDLPSVTLIVAVYNEEKVIGRKLKEIAGYEYPSEKLDIIIVSDGSKDETENIVRSFIEKRGSDTIPAVRLMVVKGRVGKTVAQNEAVRTASGEICAFSDANSVWEKDALRILVSGFADSGVGYVSGRLKYVNRDEDLTGRAEKDYWKLDLAIRRLESRIASITNGNGAIYAMRKKLYVDLPPLISHDGTMPTKMVLQGFTAKYESRAVACERASSNPDDEFRRKIRMQRGQPWKKYHDIKKYNFFRYGWFSYFYLGHKYIKYLLYLFHPVFYISNCFLLGQHFFYQLTFAAQTLFFVFAAAGYLLRKKKKIFLFYYPYHYCFTVIAQFCSVVNTLRGSSKAVWEKSETTRETDGG